MVIFGFNIVADISKLVRWLLAKLTLQHVKKRPQLLVRNQISVLSPHILLDTFQIRFCSGDGKTSD